MKFSTLEIIGLAFMSGLKIAEMAEDIMEEKDEEENTEEEVVEEKEENIATGVVKLEGEKAKEFIKFIEKLTGEEKE